jgi:multiple sugar transport system substrate-binding protein
MRNKLGFTRRDFIKAMGSTALIAGAGRGIAGCGPSAPADAGIRDAGGPRELRILQWDNFVPEFDTWFDPFAQSWGEQNNVDVTVDHAPVTMLPGMLQAQIDAGEGHDLIELINAPSDFEPFVHDLTDLHDEVRSVHGEQIPLCRDSNFNPVTNTYFGFCHAWLPDPGVYRRSLWEGIGMANGPASWADLLSGGAMIRSTQGVPVGVGLAPEIDSNGAMRALLWSYGGSIQDANRNVVINSPETIAALEYVIELYDMALTEDVLTWTPASNNEAILNRSASYIVNSISAYRSAQTMQPIIAEDIFFVPALAGPGGTALAAPHGVITYVIPRHARNVNAAKDFLLSYIGSYSEAVDASKLYFFPAYPSTTPQLTEEMGWLDSDPFDSVPVDKLSVLKTAESWSAPVGYPGSANPAEGEIFTMGLLPQMFAHAAAGGMTPAQAAQWAEDQMTPIFERWRAAGLV